MHTGMNGNYFLKNIDIWQSPGFELALVPGQFTNLIQGGRGHLAVYYTSPQGFMITFSYS